MKKPELKYKKWCDPLSINSSNMCSHKDNNLYSSDFTEENKTKINNLLNLRKIKDMSENLDRYYQNKQDKTRIGELKRILDFLTENKKIEISNLFMNKDITVEQFNRNINEFVIDKDILNSIPTILKDIKEIELNLNDEEIKKKSQNEEKEKQNINKFVDYIKNKDKSQGVYNRYHDVIDYKDGSSYSGNHKNEMRHGKGEMLYVNGDEYRGNWAFDKREGEGKITFSNGDTCEGVWKDDKRHGKHKYTKIWKATEFGGFEDDRSETVDYLHFDNGTIIGTYKTADDTDFTRLAPFVGRAWVVANRFNGGKTSTRKHKGGKKSKRHGKNKKHGRTKYKRTNKKTRKLQK